MIAVSRQLGITRGQAYTLAVGLAFALITATIGIPPTLRDQSAGAFANSLAGAGEAAPVARPDPAPTSARAVHAEPAAPAPVLSSGASRSAYSEPAAASSGVPSGSSSFDDGGSLGEVHRVTSVASAPGGVVVDPSTGAFYVATDRLLYHRADGTLERSFDIAGKPALAGLSIASDGGVIAVDPASAKVLRIDVRIGLVDEVATIPNVAPCVTDQAGQCEPGIRDNAPAPRATAFDRTGRLLVADSAQGIVWRLDQGTAKAWVKAPEFVSAQGLGPSGLAVDAQGDVLVAVGSSLAALTGGVYRVPVNSDGTAGTPTSVWRSNPNDQPAGVAVTTGGNVVVTLAGANRVLVLDRAGAVVATVTSSVGVPVAASPRGRSVLVANRADSTIVRVVAD